MNAEILNKLKKLLALSKSSTIAEAENAMEKAIAIAAKNDIDLATVSALTEKREDFIQAEYLEKSRKCVAQLFISKILLDHFKVKIVYTGNRLSGQKIVFLGRKSDVDFAMYVQDFLKEHMMNAWRKYQKEKDVDTILRATFFNGFYHGLNNKLIAAKKNQEASSFGEMAIEVRSDMTNKYALSIQSENEAREAFMKSQFKKLTTGPKSNLKVYGGGAQEAGYASGSATNIFRPLGDRQNIC